MTELSYDVFLSYARVDQENNQFVSKLSTELQRGFQSITGRPLGIFVDTKEIATAQMWQERIESALTQSTLMVAVMTPSYFTSEWCRKEWDWFEARESRRRSEHGLSESEELIFPVRFLEHQPSPRSHRSSIYASGLESTIRGPDER